MSDEEVDPNKCTVCLQIKAKNICENCTGRYGGVSMHLKQPGTIDLASMQRAILHGTLERSPDAPGPNQTTGKPEPKIRANPTMVDLVKEEDELESRIWDWNTAKNMPVTKAENDGKVQNPPWGYINMEAIMKHNIPVGMVGSGLFYWNAAKHKAGRFRGIIDMMDILNLPRDCFAYFQQDSEDPLEDGYLTQYRFVSKEAYQQYYHQKFEQDPNPDRVMPKKGLFATLQKCCADEMKKHGKGKKIFIPKPEKTGEEEEEEEEEEEVDQKDLQAREALNTRLKCTGFAKNFGEWALGFGFLVESDQFKVYRLWSRPIFHPAPPVKADANAKTW